MSALKILALSGPENYLPGLDGGTYLGTERMAFVPRDATPEQAAAAVPDAEAIFVDAITPVPGDLMRRLPRLRLVQSEGVAFDKIDCATAAELGIPVCNNAGGNAHAVAEQAILLMLGLLRHVRAWDQAVRDGRQIEAKGQGFANGITDLADCTVGIIGMGHIGQALAARLRAFGTRVQYTSRHRKPEALEDSLGITWAPPDKLLAQCNIVSLNAAVTDETRGMVDAAFLEAMRGDAYLINTARGDLVDNAALAAALERGAIAGAGLDTVAPEPVTSDNPLLNLSAAAADRVLFSPHVGGITTGSRRRMQQHMWDNIARLERGDRPTGIVNGVK